MPAYIPGLLSVPWPAPPLTYFSNMVPIRPEFLNKHVVGPGLVKKWEGLPPSLMMCPEQSPVISGHWPEVPGEQGHVSPFPSSGKTQLRASLQPTPPPVWAPCVPSLKPARDGHMRVGVAIETPPSLGMAATATATAVGIFPGDLPLPPAAGSAQNLTYSPARSH